MKLQLTIIVLLLAVLAVNARPRRQVRTEIHVVFLAVHLHRMRCAAVRRGTARHRNVAQRVRRE